MYVLMTGALSSRIHYWTRKNPQIFRYTRSQRPEDWRRLLQDPRSFGFGKASYPLPWPRWEEDWCGLIVEPWCCCRRHKDIWSQALATFKRLTTLYFHEDIQCLLREFYTQSMLYSGSSVISSLTPSLRCQISKLGLIRVHNLHGYTECQPSVNWPWVALNSDFG